MVGLHGIRLIYNYVGKNSIFFIFTALDPIFCFLKFMLTISNWL